MLAHTPGIKAFSETGLTDDLKAIKVPTLVMHREDAQVVPLPTTGKLSAGIVAGAVLKSYPRYPHGLPTKHADRINADLLAFTQG